MAYFQEHIKTSYRMVSGTVYDSVLVVLSCNTLNEC